MSSGGNNNSNNSQAGPGPASWVTVPRHNFQGHGSNNNHTVPSSHQGGMMAQWLTGPSPYHNLASVRVGPGSMPPPPPGASSEQHRRRSVLGVILAPQDRNLSLPGSVCTAPCRSAFIYTANRPTVHTKRAVPSPLGSLRGDIRRDTSAGPLAVAHHFTHVASLSPPSCCRVGGPLTARR